MLIPMPTRIADTDMSRLASNARSLLKFAGVGKLIGESMAEPADAFGSMEPIIYKLPKMVRRLEAGRISPVWLRASGK